MFCRTVSADKVIDLMGVPAHKAENEAYKTEPIENKLKSLRKYKNWLWRLSSKINDLFAN